MTPQASASDKAYINRTMEASIHIGLAALLAFACLMILKPFLPLVAWGIVIAVASYPAFLKMQRALSGRGGLAAVFYTLILLALVIIPVVLLAQSLVEGVQTLTAHMKDGTLAIPSPPESVAGWPIIGARLYSLWKAASENLSDVVLRFAPQIKSALPELLSASAGLGLAVLQFLNSCSQFLSRERFWRTPPPPTMQRGPGSFASSKSAARNTISWFRPRFAASPAGFSASRLFKQYARDSVFLSPDCRAQACGRCSSSLPPYCRRACWY